MNRIVALWVRIKPGLAAELPSRKTRPWRRIAAAVIVAIAMCGPALAKDFHIVALGASNTYGRGTGRHSDGVEPDQAYPAQLQALLRARGVSAEVANAGIPGDTTEGMLARLRSAVPAGTDLVILQTGGNDARKGLGAQKADTVAAIQAELASRNVKVIMLDRFLDLAPAGTHDPDGQHVDARGHAAVAAWLLPQVLIALGAR